MTTQTFPLQPPEFIKLLANDVRWGLLKALTISDRQVNELVMLLQQPMNLISYHLKKMREDALVTTRRSEADGRDVYYSLDFARLRQLFLEAGQALHPALGLALPSFDPTRLLAQRILVICTHNSARSQMAEGLFRDLSQGHIDIYSAGTDPTTVHPDAVRTMDHLGIDIQQQKSQSINDFVGQHFDYVISVCDKARENCPTFPGTAQQIHWGFPDPVAITDDHARAEAFSVTAQRLKLRIQNFMSILPTRSNEIQG